MCVEEQKKHLAIEREKYRVREQEYRKQELVVEACCLEANGVIKELVIESAKAKEHEQRRVQVMRKQGKQVADKIKKKIDKRFCDLGYLRS